MELVLTTETTIRLRTTVPTDWQLDEAAFWADAYDDLDSLQRTTGQFFPLPDDFTKRDAKDVKEVLALLRGEDVILKGDTVTVGVVHKDALDLLASHDKFRLAAAYQSMTFTLGDHEVELGPCVEVVTVDRVLNLPESRRELETTEHASVRMRVAKESPVRRYLGTQLPQ
jgi:hypothetical protein